MTGTPPPPVYRLLRTIYPVQIRSIFLGSGLGTYTSPIRPSSPHAYPLYAYPPDLDTRRLPPRGEQAPPTRGKQQAYKQRCRENRRTVPHRGPPVLSHPCPETKSYPSAPSPIRHYPSSTWTWPSSLHGVPRASSVNSEKSAATRGNRAPTALRHASSAALCSPSRRAAVRSGYRRRTSSTACGSTRRF